MRSNTLTIAAGACCSYPREAYRPADCTPEQHMGVREGMYRAARWDGLDQEAAEEAASNMYAHWLGADWPSMPVARGDHMRAFYAVRAYGRRSSWKGWTEARRKARRARTAEMLAWRERRLQAAIPQPVDALAAAEALEAAAWTQKARKARKLAERHGTTVAALIAAAYGALGEQPRYTGHPQPPVPQPWSDEDHATITNRLPSPQAGWAEVAPGHHVRLKG